MVNIVRSENGKQGTAPTSYAAPAGGSGAPGGSGKASDGRRDLSVNGRAIDYTDREFDIPQAWALLSPKMQAWANQSAGEPIADPVTHKRRCYKWADVSRTGETWDDGSSSAEYSLAMFGKRGLVVAYGLTDDLVTEPGATRWRTSRWDMPIDAGGLRHDHLSGALGNTSGGSSTDSSDSAACEDAAGLLDADTAANLGNLPAQTQSFLLEPFVRSGSAPQDGGVQALRSAAGRHLTEELWVYFFNGRWLAFSYARRSAPQRQRRTGVDELARVPWDLAAWVAPVARTGRPELTA